MRALLLASVMVVGWTGLPAYAAPTFTNPNFNGDFSGPTYYGVPPGWTFRGFGTGSAPQDTSSFWDNGAAINNPSQVGFIQNYGGTQSSLAQQVSGFTVGDTYTIGIYANSRTPTAAVLDIILNGTVTLLATSISPVAPSGNFTTPFGSYLSTSFVATDTSNTITFQNGSLVSNTALLLTNARIIDVSDAQAPVPEPASLALLGIGVAGLIAQGRKRGRPDHLQPR